MDWRSVQKYRPEISWSVPTYRLDWGVLGYSRAAISTSHAC